MIVSPTPAADAVAQTMSFSAGLLPMPTKAVIDHRIYTIALRKMPEFLEVFQRLAMPVLMRTLGHPLGFYTSWVGPQNQFVHLWGYDDLADYERRSLARDADPGFAPYLAASGPLITAQETRLIRAIDLRPPGPG